MDKWLEQFARANFRRSSDTAHDLKTPLNVAVLNLELLRMRIAKMAEASSDERIGGYTSAIETELRRLGRIFDTFFILSTPPRDEDLGQVDLGVLATECAKATRNSLSEIATAVVRTHESRMRQAMKLFFEGASKLFPADDRAVWAGTEDDRFEVSISGKPRREDFELSKIFKFYYTDSLGSPDLSLATARLIAETYGGELSADEDRDKVVLRLSFPLGDP